jgi:hypothetical protein
LAYKRFHPSEPSGIGWRRPFIPGLRDFCLAVDGFLTSVKVFFSGDYLIGSAPMRRRRIRERDSGIFPADFLLAIKTLVNIHHSLYRTLPPQGIYFEALVQEAFIQIKKPFTPIEPSGPTQPAHDLLVQGVRH